MRRVLAITVITALICSTGMPVWASACEAMHKTSFCHRVPGNTTASKSAPKHHCDSMVMEDEQDATPALDSETFVKGSSHECPMHCCEQAQARASSAVASATLIDGLVSSEDPIYVPAVPFSTPGFSSHTDRGPPAA